MEFMRVNAMGRMDQKEPIKPNKGTKLFMKILIIVERNASYMEYTPYITTGDRLFAECQVVYRVLFSGTRQRRLCRVFFLHSAKCFFLHSAKKFLCRVFFFGTRQRSSLPSVFFLTLGKENFKVHFEAVN